MYPITKNKLVLLVVFYKSTLILSIASSTLLACLNFFNVPAMLMAFGLCFLSGGTVISLLHKEMAKKDEYYFYYNKGLSKLTLILSCVTGNLIIGVSLITISIYAGYLRN